MPGRQIIGGQPYRYGYQGEFAETDPETGKPAFQLRLYDPRINRWISPDPYGQYDSPYMSMGNNWTNRVDPDGGMDCPDPPCGGHQPPGTEAMNSNLPIGDGTTTNTIPTITLDEVVVTATSSSSNSGLGINRNLLTGTKLSNSFLSLGITNHLDNINFSQLSQVPDGYFSTTYNGNTVTWNNNFRGNGSVSGSFVKDAKLDFSKTLSTGKTLSNIKGVSSVLGNGLTALSVGLDTHSYMTGEISGHRYSWKMGTTGASFGVGLAAGTGPGLLIGVGAMAVEKGYDVFVDPQGPVWSNYGSWIPTSAGGIMQGFGGW